MKNDLLIITCLIFLLTSSCSEKSVIIPESHVPEGDRKVLIEEFTGVNCLNCPDGSKIIEEMIAELGENVVAISIHTGFFAKKIKGSINDLKSPSKYGEGIIELLEKGPLGYPAAVVNRSILGSKLFPNKDEWKALVIEELKKEARLNVYINHSYDEDSRNINVTLNILPLKDGLVDLNVTLALIESNVIDAQRLPDNSIDVNYVHRHVLRDALTSVKGQKVLGDYQVGTAIEIELATYSLNPNWKAKDCNLIAIIHHKDNSNEVLQVEEVHLM